MGGQGMSWCGDSYKYTFDRKEFDRIFGDLDTEEIWDGFKTSKKTNKNRGFTFEINNEQNRKSGKPYWPSELPKKKKPSRIHIEFDMVLGIYTFNIDGESAIVPDGTFHLMLEDLEITTGEIKNFLPEVFEFLAKHERCRAFCFEPSFEEIN